VQLADDILAQEAVAAGDQDALVVPEFVCHFFLCHELHEEEPKNLFATNCTNFTKQYPKIFLPRIARILRRKTKKIFSC
jgi:hypothetical protein